MSGEYISPKQLAEQRNQQQREQVLQSQLAEQALAERRISAVLSNRRIWKSVVDAGLPEMTVIEVAHHRRTFPYRQRVRRALQSLAPKPTYLPEGSNLVLEKTIQGYKIPDSDVELSYLPANSRAQQDSEYMQKAADSVITEDGFVGVRRKSKYYSHVVTAGQIIESSRNCIIAAGLEFMPLNQHPYPELLEGGLKELALQLNTRPPEGKEG